MSPPAAEVVGEPRHRDVVADVALFLGVLVGHDREPLDGLRVEPPDDDRGEEPDADGQPERPDHPRERATDEQRRGDPGQDGQDVVGEELGVLVGEADAGRDAPGAVDELELVELVAERDRQQEQPAEDGEVDADRRREHEPAARGADDVAGEARTRAPMTRPLNRPWMRRRNGSSNRKKLMSLLKIGSVTRRRRRERDAVDPEQDRLPRPRHRAADEQRDEQGDPAEDPAGERGQVRHVAGVEGDGVGRLVARTGRGRGRTSRRRVAAASLVGRLGRVVDPVDQRPDASRRPAVARRRRQPPGQPQVAEQDDRGEHERPDPESERRGDPRPEDRIEARRSGTTGHRSTGRCRR